MNLRKTPSDITKFSLVSHPVTSHKNVRHIGTSLCREVRSAHFKSLFFISTLGFIGLGAIAWFFHS